MEKILLVLCHPRQESFNHRLAERLKSALSSAGKGVLFHDLYAEDFDPVLREDELLRKFSLDDDVQQYYRELEEAAGIVVVHPDWWGQPPALMKGWIDRVFRPGIAYEFAGEEFTRKTAVPLLKGKQAALFCTSDSPAPAAGRRKGADDHPAAVLWRDRVFGYCGIENTVCNIFYSFFEAGPAERRRWLDQAAAVVRELWGG